MTRIGSAPPTQTISSIVTTFWLLAFPQRNPTGNRYGGVSPLTGQGWSHLPVFTHRQWFRSCRLANIVKEFVALIASRLKIVFLYIFGPLRTAFLLFRDLGNFFPLFLVFFILPLICVLG